MKYINILFIENNGIGKEGATAFKEALKINQIIQNLELGNQNK